MKFSTTNNDNDKARSSCAIDFKRVWCIIECNLISMHLTIPMEVLLLVGVEYCGMTGKVTPTLSSLQR